ncbi:MAG: diacylglycerol kinase family protein [Crocinitomicaceae bacterium]
MTKEKFSIRRRIKAFKFAFSGIFYFFKTVHNSWVHLLATALVIIAGCYFNITATDWLWVLSAIFLVFIAELLNTAIEKVVDLTSPNTHELAKRSKDLAAAAVLLAAVFAIIVGVIIFIPYFVS